MLKLKLKLIIFLFFSTALSPQNEPGRSAQEMLARLDQAVNPGTGLLKGTLTVIKRTGDSSVWNTSVFRSKDDSLFLFEKGRGLEAKILFKDEGDKTYLYNAQTAKLFQKNEEEKFQPHFNSGFTFLDLSGYSYQVNYNPLIQATQEISGKQYIRVSMKPIISMNYKKLVLLLETGTFRPFRIDFHDKDGVLFKTLNFKYTKVKVKEKKQAGEMEFPGRLEMLDLNSGTISVFEYHEFDRDVAPDKALFEISNLNR
ncbi:MAG: outer membrane lipoprotein-sorting protein [Leptospira sp.]|nr:outer membrane lipoprotein-sorting protein [Leptospira sp.]